MFDPQRPVDSACAPAGGVDATTAALADLVDRIMYQQHPRVADSLVAAELTVSQLRILFTLVRHPDPLPMHEVAEAVQLSLPTAGRAADRLVAAGLVDRQEDERDRRVKLVSLAPAGLELLREKFQLNCRELTAMVASLPDGVRERLSSAITETLEHLPRPPGLLPMGN